MSDFGRQTRYSETSDSIYLRSRTEEKWPECVNVCPECGDPFWRGSGHICESMDIPARGVLKFCRECNVAMECCRWNQIPGKSDSDTEPEITTDKPDEVRFRSYNVETQMDNERIIRFNNEENGPSGNDTDTDTGSSVEQFQFEQKVLGVLMDIKALLVSKNKQYGDSALKPIRVFSKAEPLEQLNVRIDDKLKRIQTMGDNADPEDSINDLLGYLVLYKIGKKATQ